MVFLTMTPAIVAAVKQYQSQNGELSGDTSSSDPSLLEPEVGKPISHGQIIDISRALRAQNSEKPSDGASPHHLNTLLQGSQVYVAPPTPKREQTNEYRQLMARLRREEEQRMYHRMVHPQQPGHDLLSSKIFREGIDAASAKEEEDEVTFADINRQVALIINVLVSIIACGITIWVAARHWNAPSRLALSMSGGGVVGVAEVVVYAGYIRRLKEAKTKERSKTEKKFVTDTWVIEGKDTNKTDPISISKSEDSIDSPDGLRLRKAQAR